MPRPKPYANLQYNDITTAMSQEHYRLAHAIDSIHPSMATLAITQITYLLIQHTSSRIPIPDHQSHHLDKCYKTCASRDLSLPGTCYLGYLFTQGVFPLSKNPVWANFFIQRCAHANNCSLARYFLAVNLERGICGKEDLLQDSILCEQVIASTGLKLTIRNLAALLDRGAEDIPNDSLRAAELYQLAVLHGTCTDAMDSLAEIYAQGRPHVPRCPWRAANLFERSIELSQGSRAMVGLASLLENGHSGVERDVSRAARLYQAAIDQDGNSQALNNLASMLLHGLDCIEKDARRATSLWELASLKGNLHAKRNLARILETGDEGVMRNHSRAIELYEEIVNFDEFRAVRFNLAFLLSNNVDENSQNTIRAAKLYQEIIKEEADIHAMFNLACLLSEGSGGLEQNISEAINLYERAIKEGGHISSMHSLGILLSSDIGGANRNMRKATYLLEKAIECGRKEACFDLGLLLSCSESDMFDISRGMKLYEMAIEELDHMGAMINAAEILYEGKGNVKRDVEGAIALCNRAIVQGVNGNTEFLNQIGIEMKMKGMMRDEEDTVNIREHAMREGWHLLAMCNLGDMLLGEGKEIDKALKLYETAMKNWQFPEVCKSQSMEFDGTLRALQRIVRMDIGSKNDVDGAIEVYELLIDRAGNEEAMYCLGEILMAGGNKSNMSRAMKLWEDAADRGFNKAKMNLGEILWRGNDEMKQDLNRAVKLFGDVVRQESNGYLRREAVVKLAMILGNHVTSST